MDKKIWIDKLFYEIDKQRGNLERVKKEFELKKKFEARKERVLRNKLKEVGDGK